MARIVSKGEIMNITNGASLIQYNFPRPFTCFLQNRKSYCVESSKRFLLTWSLIENTAYETFGTLLRNKSDVLIKSGYVKLHTNL